MFSQFSSAISIVICALTFGSANAQAAASSNTALTGYPQFPCDFWVGMSYYNFNSLMSPGNNYKKDNAQWNFCTFADSNSGQYDVKDTFAFLTRAGSSWTLPMTGYSSYYDDISETDKGVQIVQKSSTKCAVSSDNTSFKATIQCDWSIRGQGQAKIITVDHTTSPCQLQVVMAHRAGCGGTEN